MERDVWQHRRDILICIICGGIILWALWNVAGQFVDAIIIFLLSMAVAFLLTPLVNFVVSLKVPRAVAAVVIYVVVLGTLCILGYTLIFSLIKQLLAFQNTVVNFFTALPNTYQTLLDFLRKQGVSQVNIDAALLQIRDQAIAFAQMAASNAVGIVFLVTNAFINILVVVVLSFYLVLDGKRIRDSLISVTPKRIMPHVQTFERALNEVVGNYIRGQLTLAAIIGMLAGLGCGFLGLGDYALIIGVLAFLFETIPMVGPALASIPALLISLLLPDPLPRTIWIALYFVIIQMVESNILGPRIVGHAVGLHPVASILALLVGAKLFGAFGALLATPVVAAAWVVVASIYRSARGETSDQIMARKPAPWTMRRPSDLSLRGRRRTRVLHPDHPLPTGPAQDEGHPPQPQLTRPLQEHEGQRSAPHEIEQGHK